MSDVNPAVIKLTQQLLGKYVQKPQMSDKLLSKPPFRFLHDVITAVIKNTGFFDGLYTEAELNHQNIKDKAAKIDFLTKIVDAVKLITKENLRVKPSKIVAGQEPERTNELLQAIGKALDLKLSSTDAVKSLTNSNTTATKKPEAIIKSVPKTTQQNKEIKQNAPNQDRKKPKASEDPVKPSNKSIKRTDSSENKIKDKTAGRSKVEKPRPAPNKKVSEKPAIVEKVEKIVEPVKISLPENKHKVEDSIPVEHEIRIENTVQDEPKIQAEHQTELKNEISESKLQIDKPEIPMKITTDENISILPVDELGPEKVIDSKPVISKSSSGKADREKTKQSDNVDNPVSDSEAMRSSTISEVEPSVSAKPKKRTKEKKIKKSIETVTETIPETVTETVTKAVTETVPENLPESTIEAIEVVLDKDIVIKDQKGLARIRPRTSLRPPSVRPASARPGAPRQRDRNLEIVLQAEENSDKTMNPNLNVDNFQPNSELDDEADNLIIIEDPMIDHNTNIRNIDNNLDADTMHGQGHLVQQILNTQKEFTNIEVEVGQKEAQRTENGYFSNTSNQRLSSAKQIESLRDSIQKLTWSVNPLGKLMDFLQEDIDSMQIELSIWRKVLESTRADLKRESGLTQSAIQPLKQQLSDVEENITEYFELINASRLKIIQNEEHILKFLNDL